MKEAGGGEALETGKVLEHLNMQLMTVDSAVEIKYMDILQEDDEEKRKELEDGVSIMIYLCRALKCLSHEKSQETIYFQ